MPFAAVAADSILFARSGRMPAGALKSSHEVLGVDRHGQPVFRGVTTERSAESRRCGCLGTGTTFGIFADVSRILLADGTVRSVLEIVESGTIADHRFEHHLEVSESVTSRLVANSVWTELVTMSAVHDSSCVALRCRAQDIEKRLTSRRGMVAANAGSHAYCIVKKDAFTSAASVDWSGTIDELVNCWCYSPEDDRVEIERGLTNVIAWYLAANALRSMAYTISYDSLQHSSYVFVMKTDASSGLIEKGRSAFLVPESASIIQLKWDERSWNPVCSGFLLAGT